MSTSNKPGPESKITVQLVRRVSKLVANGIPIRLALQAESVTCDAYKKHLQRHPELAVIQATAKIKFLKGAIDMIRSKNGPLLKWLLERRHSSDFSPNQEDDDPFTPETAPQSQTQIQTQTQTLAGVPEHLIDELRKQAPHA